METTQRIGKTITIYPDSKITLDKQRNKKIHTYLIEETRKIQRNEQSKLGSKSMLDQSTRGYNGKLDSVQTNKKGVEE
jgi:hypothetical protein